MDNARNVMHSREASKSLSLIQAVKDAGESGQRTQSGSRGQQQKELLRRLNMPNFSQLVPLPRGRLPKKNLPEMFWPGVMMNFWISMVLVSIGLLNS